MTWNVAGQLDKIISPRWTQYLPGLGTGAVRGGGVVGNQGNK